MGFELLLTTATAVGIVTTPDKLLRAWGHDKVMAPEGAYQFIYLSPHEIPFVFTLLISGPIFRQVPRRAIEKIIDYPYECPP
jgi:hypothetical protein